jgi:hypothetical protein
MTTTAETTPLARLLTARSLGNHLIASLAYDVPECDRQLCPCKDR